MRGKHEPQLERLQQARRSRVRLLIEDQGASFRDHVARNKNPVSVKTHVLRGVTGRSKNIPVAEGGTEHLIWRSLRRVFDGRCQNRDPEVTRQCTDAYKMICVPMREDDAQDDAPLGQPRFYLVNPPLPFDVIGDHRLDQVQEFLAEHVRVRHPYAPLTGVDHAHVGCQRSNTHFTRSRAMRRPSSCFSRRIRTRCRPRPQPL